jgi:3-isopropylmalate/(R)-2-methylmalate dehydratase small subunit
VATYRNLTSRFVVLPVDDIDTDQIIPARFLKVTDKAGLGEKLFCDWRYRADGSPNPDFVLNRPEARGAQVLVAGANFGCGSSREHAPWALMDFGLRAVVSTSFADIFRSNALKNGLLPVAVDPATHAALMALGRQGGETRVTIDLESTTLSFPGGAPVTFPIDLFSRRCLLGGVDELGYLLSFAERIAAHEKRAEG